MGLAHSPKIVTDGLAFIYDTGSGKSYKGEPTTNLYGNWNAYTGGSYEVLDNNTNYIKLLASAGAPWAGQFTAAVSAGTYTVSFQHRTDDGGSNNFNIDNDTQDDNLWNANITTTTEWQTYTSTKTHTGTGNHLLYFRRNSGTGNIYIRNLQLELKPHATPFVNGTRSATQGLLDLTNNATINLSNVSFDSNAQVIFDGTDDTINTGLYSGRNPATDPFTIEAVVKSDTTSGGRMWVDATNNGSNQRLYCAHAATGTGNPMGIQGSGWSSSAPHDTDYHHYVIVMDGSVARLYNNGEAHSTKNYTSYQIQALNIGGRNTYRWFGDIPIFKLYDRALTAEEVAQNYNAFKGRFL